MGNSKDGGIWGHSSPIGANHYILFAVSDNLIMNAALTGWMKGQGIGYKPLLGSYKGKTEQSYITSYENLPKLFAVGWLAGQESVLVLGPCNTLDERPASLMFLNPEGNAFIKGEDIGMFRTVSRAKAHAQEAWTYDPSTGEYYVCVDPEAIELCPVGLGAVKNLVHTNGRATFEEVITTYLKNRKKL